MPALTDYEQQIFLWIARRCKPNSPYPSRRWCRLPTKGKYKIVVWNAARTLQTSGLVEVDVKNGVPFCCLTTLGGYQLDHIKEQRLKNKHKYYREQNNDNKQFESDSDGSGNG